MSFSGSSLPLAVETFTPNLSRTFWILSVGDSRRVTAPRSAVPAIDALMPALPIRAIEATVSVNLRPAWWAIGPAYLNASPRSSTLVLALTDALTMASIAAGICLTVMPYPVITDVEISAARVRSSCSLDASASTDGIDP